MVSGQSYACQSASVVGISVVSTAKSLFSTPIVVGWSVVTPTWSETVVVAAHVTSFQLPVVVL